MADQKKSRPRTFGRPEGDGNPPQPRNAGPQAPIAGMFTSSVKSIAAENETLRAERDKAVLSGSMLLELDPATIEDGLVSDRLEVRGDDQEFEDLKASIASRGCATIACGWSGPPCPRPLRRHTRPQMRCDPLRA